MKRFVKTKFFVSVAEALSLGCHFPALETDYDAFVKVVTAGKKQNGGAYYGALCYARVEFACLKASALKKMTK